MTTTTKSPLTHVRRPRVRSAADHPLVWKWHQMTFLSTCPKCGHERPQLGYTRRVLFSLLVTRRKIDAYCAVCNVCWEISESERRAISRQ